MLNKVIKYFYPKQDVSYFSDLKIRFFIIQNIIGIFIILLFVIPDILSPNDNFITSILSKILGGIILFISLFILKKKGIKTAGNIYSVAITVMLLVSMNLFNDKNFIYRFFQGFYSVFPVLALSVLFSSRKIIIINAILIFITTTRIYLSSLNKGIEYSDLINAGYITHSTGLIFFTILLYFANKFSESAIIKANKEVKIKEIKNRELTISEERIRAVNKKLRASEIALKESNDKLKKALTKAQESNDLKTEFINNMSHEIRTPMNGIIGFAQLLNVEHTDNESIKKYSNVILNSSTQLLNIIENIMDISKLGTGQVNINNNEFNLNDLLLELYSIYDDRVTDKNISFILKNETEKNYNIFTDREKLHKILSSLLENAFKFTSSGFVKLGCKIEDKDNLLFYVEDSGIGIEKVKYKSIFNKFSQANIKSSREYGGLGLGLAIAKENTLLLDGSIYLSSIVGKGTTFFVSIPSN